MIAERLFWFSFLTTASDFSLPGKELLPRKKVVVSAHGEKEAEIKPTDENRFSPVPDDFVERLLFFVWPDDGRFEDLTNGAVASSVWLCVFRDFIAGLVVAMVAIPLAMGFAIASGLRPVHGIVGGAIAGFMGAAFGGSKYQVYGPTAALIPVIAGIMNNYGPDEATYEYGHGILVFTSIIAGFALMILGLARMGRYVAQVPHSIVVGFTIGIAVTIVLAESGEILGIKEVLPVSFFEKMAAIYAHINEFNIWCLLIALFTFAVSKSLLRVSVYIPAPLIALGVSTALSMTVLSGVGLVRVVDKYGELPAKLIKFTPPAIPPCNLATAWDIMWRAVAIVFVCGVESLLCSRMADRLAHNTRLPFNPNKELWGQGWVNVICPLMNGFPHTGALARTATNIKVGAVSPLAGILKATLKLALAFFLRGFLEEVPMACVGGILLYVAVNMISVDEVSKIWAQGSLPRFLMVYTAVMVPITDFLKGVLSACILAALIPRVLGIVNKQEDIEQNPLLASHV